MGASSTAATIATAALTPPPPTTMTATALADPASERGKDPVRRSSSPASSDSPTLRCNNNGSRRTSAVVVDATRLRRVLRAVHCLQKERGASCAFCVSLRGDENDSELLRTSRSATDRAFAAVASAGDDGKHHDSDGDLTRAVEITLSKIRKMIDRCNRENLVDEEEDDGQPPPSVRRLLVSFSTLISAVLHEFVHRYTLFQRAPELLRKSNSNAGRNGYDDASDDGIDSRGGGATGTVAESGMVVVDPAVSASPRSSSSNLPRVRSHGQFHHEISASSDLRRDAGAAATARQRRCRQRSDGGAMMAGGGPGGYRRRPSDSSAGASSSLLRSLESGSSIAESESWASFPHSSSPPPSASELRPQQRQRQNASNSDCQTSDVANRSRQVNLLGLLDIFVRLKESNGVERASLTSIMVSDQDDDDVGLILNDVVLEVENQRRLLEELAMLPPGPLRNLVQELVTMSEQMVQLQNLVLAGASLDSIRARYNSDVLWDVMTVYIDKLHSLELLIVEEIEFCSPPPSRSDRGKPGDLSRKLMDGAFGSHESVDDLVEAIKSMSPADVKKRMVAMLKKEPSVRVQEAYVKKGVDELLKELCNGPAMKEWEIDIYELRFLKRIGLGSAGTTYVADWSGLKVAVKVASISEMGLEGWRTEVQALQKLHHPNIIRLLGSVYHPHPLTFCLVLEYCDGGDLASALCKVAPRNFFYHVAVGMAKGLCYLHARGIIHRDVKPSNVLLQGELSPGKYQVKVTDFGVATELDTTRDRTAETGTYRWMAPEVIRHETYSQTADMYSYAIVLWQLLTREEPFANLGQIEAAVSVSMEHARPPLPSGTPRPVLDLIEECWREDPQQRPSFDDIADTLTDIFESSNSSLDTNEKLWLDSPLGHRVYLDDEQQSEEQEDRQQEPSPELQIPELDQMQQPGQKKGERKRNLLRTMFRQRKSSHF